MKNVINSLLKKFDLQIVRRSHYENNVNSVNTLQEYELLPLIDQKHHGIFLDCLSKTNSQLRQDLFVLNELDFKENGYFVEFGATDGIKLSNSYLLEKSFNWKGILAEPARIWHNSLDINRSAKIEKDCVWSKSKETLLFNEVVDNEHKGELSTIASFSRSDEHRGARLANSFNYEVSTISLYDMLKKHNAPQNIDYLSIDTEGSEYEILKSFNFNEFNIKVITCEHNYTPMREKIFNLLTTFGYVRKHTKISRFDDWYVRE